MTAPTTPAPRSLAVLVMVLAATAIQGTEDLPEGELVTQYSLTSSPADG